MTTLHRRSCAPHQDAKQSVRRLESITAAAHYLGVSTKTIRRYIAAGLITGYRAGPRLIRVDLNELDAMLRPIPAASGGDLHGAV